MARPEAIIDWKKVDFLLEAGSTGTEVAAHLGIHYNTFYNRVKEKYKCDFSEYMQEKRAKGDSLLRSAQFKNAMEGNTSMQIWLGKQRLGQREPKNEEEKNTTNNTYYVNYDPTAPLPVLSKDVSTTDSEGTT